MRSDPDLRSTVTLHLETQTLGGYPTITGQSTKSGIYVAAAEKKPSQFDRAIDIELTSENETLSNVTATSRLIFGVKKGFLITCAVGIIFGLLGTVAGTLFVQPMRTTPLTKAAVVKVSILENQADVSAAANVAPAVAPVVIPVQIPLINPEEFVRGRQVQVGKGEVSYMADTQRAFAPGFIAPPKGIKAAKPKLTEALPVLRVNPASPERYIASGSSLEWQGGWKFNDPQGNVRIGSAYTSYLENHLGKGLTSGLSSFEPAQADTLKAVKGNLTGIRSVRKY